ncbi:MAG: cytochrome c1 [Cycloclasticus sp.]|nr:MAG: cytochrome c1 [Cycloclasticus sp.]
MRQLLFIIFLLVAPQTYAAGGKIHLESATIDISNEASLQRGAKYFVNYCLGCHSAKQLRYSRMSKDLNISPELTELNLMFTGEKIFDGMNISMTVEDAEKWFGVAPPDLSLIARSRGADWLYTYLKSFYMDDSRPFGVNNLVFPDVGMPHALADLQGLQAPIYKEVEREDGTFKKVIDRLEVVVPGRFTEKGYDSAMNDLVNFLVYMGEPAKLERQRLGWKVLLFLLVMIGIFYLLKKEFWKDIH